MSSSKNTWRALRDLAITLHELMYEKHDLCRAKILLPELQSLLERLPQDDGSIVRAEGFALFCELAEDLGQAILYRRREVELMEQLHESFHGNEHDDLKRWALTGRTVSDLETRKSIIISLERQADQEKGADPAP